MSYLTITFTGRNPFTEAEIARGIEAAEAIFKKHGLNAELAWERNLRSMDENFHADDVWTEADYAACLAMCGGDDTNAADNATLEMVQ